MSKMEGKRSGQPSRRPKLKRTKRSNRRRNGAKKVSNLGRRVPKGKREIESPGSGWETWHRSGDQIKYRAPSRFRSCRIRKRLRTVCSIEQPVVPRCDHQGRCSSCARENPSNRELNDSETRLLMAPGAASHLYTATGVPQSAEDCALKKAVPLLHVATPSSRVYESKGSSSKLHGVRDCRFGRPGA